MSGGTLSILLSFTSGIFSLVGLMSIFISMNSQHNVQRAREILWNLAALPYQKDLFLDKGAIGKEVFRKFILYEQIINERHNFSRIIISFAQVGLGFCLTIWTIIAVDMFVTNKIFLERVYLISLLGVIHLFILYFILKVLEDLKSTSKVGRLPTVQEIIDADHVGSGLSVVTLAAISSCLRITDSQIYLGFPIPFKNLRLNLTLPKDEKEFIYPKYSGQTDFKKRIDQFNELKLHEYRILDDDYCWYPVSRLKKNEVHQKGMLATLEIYSQQGYVTAEFYIEDLAKEKGANNKIYPYSYAERFINRVSELDPFSVYGRRDGDEMPDSKR